MRVSRWAHLGLATLTGLLYFLAFPGVDAWPLAFVAWVPWLIGLEGRSTKQAIWGGLWIGLVTGFTGFYWLLGMLETFSGFSTPLCALFMSLLCLYQGGRFALLGVLYVRGKAHGWWPGWVFSLAFIASETLYPLLFPFYFGATLHGVPALIQVAELGGPIAIALVSLGPNWAITQLILVKWRAQRAGVQSNLLALLSRQEKLRLTGALLLPLLAALYGFVRIQQVDAAVAQADKIRVGLVQANMGLSEKRTDFREGKKRHIDLTRKLRDEDKVDLVVWAETSLAGAIPEDQADDHYYRTLTRHLKVPTIVGAVLARPVDDAREYALFNSALISDRTGKIRGRYDKQYLLAFGEYLPFGESFPVLYDWSPNSSQFSPGKSYDPLPLGDRKIAVFICYEDLIPSFVNRIMGRGEAELLVNMTNDAWFGDTSEPWEHMALSKLRAVEQRRFFVRSTNSGISGFVDPVGRLLQQTPTFEQAAIAEEVAWLRLRTPYQFLGDTPWWLLSLVSIFLAWKKRKTATQLSPSP